MMRPAAAKTHAGIWRCGLLLMAAAGTAAGQSSTARPTKRALIIAVGNYPSSSGYARINVGRDVELVQGTLEAQGFEAGQIRILRDHHATRQGILSALHALAGDTRQGDAVVLHYSGHGHRISDDNGDEIDGFDEVLVPYGAPAAIRTPGYRGEQHIRDDELLPILADLRSRAGAAGSVTVFIDACFSGSATRGPPDEPVVRGILDPLVVRRARMGTAPGSDAGSGLLDMEPQSRGEAGSASAGLSPLVVLSASRHDQVARESVDEQRRPVGSLSLALSRSLPRLGPGSTYRNLFDLVGAAMATMNLADQRPQIEGSVDVELFGGQAVVQRPFVRVLEQPSDSTIDIAGGTVLGLHPGTRLAVYPSGTADPAGRSPIVMATVRQATAVRSTAVVSPLGGKVALGGTWGFVTEYAFGDLRLQVALDSLVPPDVKRRLLDAVADVPTVTVVPSHGDLRIVPVWRNGRDGLGIIDRTGKELPMVPVELARADAAERVRDILRVEARSRYLRQLELSSPKIQVRMELVQTEPRLSWDGGQATCSGAPPRPLPNSGAATNGVVLSPRDEYSLRLINDGPNPAYVVVLSLQPGGKISQIYPLPESLGADNYLPAGRTFLIQDVCFFAEEPYGTETLKLLATSERLDFTPLLSGGYAVTRAGAHPLLDLFAEGDGTSRGVAVAAPSGAGSTYAVTIMIEPRKKRP